MNDLVNSLLHILPAIGIAAAFAALSCGVKHLCRSYLKKKSKNVDK